MRTPTQFSKTVNEMQQARGRLRGALNETLRGSDEEENTDEVSGDTFIMKEQEQIKPVGRGRPPKVRRDSNSAGGMLHSPSSIHQDSVSPSKLNLTPSKRRKRDEQLAALQQMQRIQAESFVMKLFDRSLDLSKYSECTELYPICRAWMANQPRNLSIQYCRNQRSPSPVVREANGMELLTKLKRGEIREITALPAPEQTDLPKIPIIEQECGEAAVEAAKKLKNASKEDLLASHMGKWKRIKKSWVKHTKRYQQRYELNHMIIQELFKP